MNLSSMSSPAFSVCVYCGSRTGENPLFAAVAAEVEPFHRPAIAAQIHDEPAQLHAQSAGHGVVNDQQDLALRIDQRRADRATDVSGSGIQEILIGGDEKAVFVDHSRNQPAIRPSGGGARQGGAPLPARRADAAFDPPVDFHRRTQFVLTFDAEADLARGLVHVEVELDQMPHTHGLLTHHEEEEQEPRAETEWGGRHRGGRPSSSPDR